MSASQTDPFQVGFDQMEMADLLIAQMNFLQDLPPGEWQQILVPSAKSVRLRRDQPLYQQDQPLDHIYILLEGTVRQVRQDASGDDQRQSHERTVDRPGTILSIYGLLFYDNYRTTTQEAGKGSCLLVQFDASAFNRLIFRFPQLRRELANMALIRRMHTMPILGHLDLELLGMLSEEATVSSMATDEVIYSDGELTENVFFVDQGQVRLDWDDGNTVRWAANGAAFGLLYDEPNDNPSVNRRTRAMMHTAQVTTPTAIISIPFDLFRSIAGRDPDVIGAVEMKRRRDTIRRLPIFAELDEHQRDRLVGFFGHYHFPINQLLVQQGEQADSFWVLLHGGSAMIQALDEDGKYLGRLKAPGIRPSFSDRLADIGIRLPGDLFDPEPFARRQDQFSMGR